MEDNFVKCVKIVHHPAEVRVFRILSAFFRFVGIFACENLVGDEYGDEVDYTCNVMEGSEDSGSSFENQAFELLSQMKERFRTKSFRLIMQIWSLFVNNNF